VASSLFCFERDPHGLSHPFQTAKVLFEMNFSIEFRSHPDPKEGTGSLRDLRVVTMDGEAVVPNSVEVLPQI
jgi:hypothetical protein